MASWELGDTNLNKVKFYFQEAQNLVKGERETCKQSQHGIRTRAYIRYRKEHRGKKELWKTNKHQEKTLRGASIELRKQKEGILYFYTNHMQSPEDLKIPAKFVSP